MTTQKIADPEQPVAWMSTYDKQLLLHHPAEYGRDPSGWVPLFTAPQPPADVAEEVFDAHGPETPQVVRDVIEWFASSIRARGAA